MTFLGPELETIGMRRSGLWLGLIVCTAMGAAFLLPVLGVFPERPSGWAAWALWAFTALLFLGAFSNLKELLFPRPLIRVTAQGLAFRIRTGRGVWEAPWSQVKEVRAGEDNESNTCLDVELVPDPGNPIPTLSMNTGLGPANTLRFHKGSLAGDLTLTAQRLEAYRRSFLEER